MSIAKNTFYITGAFIFQKILTFFYIALVARNLGPEQTGQYFLALSFTTIFSVFVDLGLTPVLIREVAKHRQKAGYYFRSILTLKTISLFLISILVVVLANIFSYEKNVKNLIYIATLVMVFDSLSLTFYGILRSYQNLKFESLGIAFYQVFVVIFGGIGLLIFKSAYWIIGVLALASFLNAFYSFFLAKTKAGIKFSFSWDKKFNQYLFGSAWPFFLAGIFNRIYTHVDVIFISKFLDNLYVGWYTVANKLIFALQFIPSAFVASVYPAMSNYHARSPEKLKLIFEKSLVYLMMISIPLCFGVLALSPEVILTLYGEKFLNSVLPLRLLSVSLVFVFLYFPIGSLLNASNRQKANTANMGIAMLINVLLNLMLIPKINLAGAALASIFSQATMFFLGMFYANQVISYNKKFLAIKFLQNFITAGIMAEGIILLKGTINWIFLVPLAVIFYFTFLYLIKGFALNDIKEIFTSLGIKKYEQK